MTEKRRKRGCVDQLVKRNYLVFISPFCIVKRTHKTQHITRGVTLVTAFYIYLYIFYNMCFGFYSNAKKWVYAALVSGPVPFFIFY